MTDVLADSFLGNFLRNTYGIVLPEQLSFLRTFRLLRVFKLAKNWKGYAPPAALRHALCLLCNIGCKYAEWSVRLTRHLSTRLAATRRLSGIFSTMAYSLKDIFWLMLLLLLVMFVYAVVGVQLFGTAFQSFREDPEGGDEKPRFHFENFSMAMITVFVVISGENWNDIMGEVVIAMDSHLKERVAVAYFTSLVLIGNFIILNLFLAILLDNFAQSAEEDEASAREAEAEADDDASGSGSDDDEFGESAPAAADGVAHCASMALEAETGSQPAAFAPATVAAAVAADASLLRPAPVRQAGPMPSPHLPPVANAAGRESADLRIGGGTGNSGGSPAGSFRPTPVLSPNNDSADLAMPVKDGAVLASKEVEPASSSAAARKEPKGRAEVDSALNRFFSRLARWAADLFLRRALVLPRLRASELANNSFFIFRPDSSLRVALRDIIGIPEPMVPPNRETEPDEAVSATNRENSGPEPIFEVVVKFLIVFSAITLAMESPKAHLDRIYGRPVDEQQEFLAVLNKLLTLFFVIEQLLKGFAQTFWMSYGVSYLTKYTAATHEDALLLAPESARSRAENADESADEDASGDQVLTAIDVLRRKRRRERQKRREARRAAAAAAAASASSPTAADVPSAAAVDSQSVVQDPALEEEAMQRRRTRNAERQALRQARARARAGARGTWRVRNWELLDFVCVMASVISIVASNNLYLHGLRALRALRPLRLIKRVRGMRVVVSTLVKSLPSVLNVLVVAAVFMAVYAVAGMHLFGGCTSSCIDGRYETKQECEATGHLWANSNVGSFDSFSSSLLAVFEIALQEGWPDMLLLCMDSSNVDEAPKRDAHRWYAIFPISWVIIGGFYIMESLVGAVADTFNRCARSPTGYPGLMSVCFAVRPALSRASTCIACLPFDALSAAVAMLCCVLLSHALPLALPACPLMPSLLVWLCSAASLSSRHQPQEARVWRAVDDQAAEGLGPRAPAPPRRHATACAPRAAPSGHATQACACMGHIRPGHEDNAAAARSCDDDLVRDARAHDRRRGPA